MPTSNGVCAERWTTSSVGTRRGFALAAAEREHVAGFDVVSGRSTSADRLATIRAVHADFAEVIDPHTADALKVGREHVEAGVPMIVLETALPAKFNETVRKAIGIDAPRPAGFEGIESLPRRFITLANDVGLLKRCIATAATA